jgi:hypothetical protein
MVITNRMKYFGVKKRSDGACEVHSSRGACEVHSSRPEAEWPFTGAFQATFQDLPCAPDLFESETEIVFGNNRWMDA